MLLPVTHRPKIAARASAAVLAVVAGVVASGCAGFRQKHPVSASVAACRMYSCQGVTALETGDYNQAESLLRQAAEASPQDADARRHLADALWAGGQQGEAVANMRSSVELQPHNAEARVRYGQMLLAGGNHSEAHDQAQQALAINPRDAAAWALRGRAMLGLGEGDRAMADLHQSLQYAPADRDVLSDLADLHKRAGQRRRELTTLHCLRETYARGEEPTELIATDADAYVALGLPTQAVERLRMACRRGNASAALLCQLAEAEAAAGDATQAVASAQLALTADANHLPAQQLLARLSGGAFR
ncbi:MAG: tetratricopeptide repeat protein [Planctomycetota bacterium]